MKFDVKKECWHKGRRLMPGDVLEVESKDVRWMTAQGKISPAAETDAGASVSETVGETNTAAVVNPAPTKKQGRTRPQQNKGENHE